MKRKSRTQWLPCSRLLLRPLPDISLDRWDLGPVSQHHCIKDMLPMKIYLYPSDRREINETDVKYSSDSLNGNSCSLLIFITSIWKSQVILAIWLALSDVIYSRIVLFCALNRIIFQPIRFEGSFKVTNQTAGKLACLLISSELELH